ncbi:MAG: ABC transporter permease subunit [Hymenobacter sp.]
MGGHGAAGSRCRGSFCWPRWPPGPPQAAPRCCSACWPWWPGPKTARLVRAQMLRVRALPFLEAARACGLPGWRVWLHHAMPHACQPLYAFAPLTLAGLVGLENTLAFLGIGQSPDVVSWGSQLATVRQDPTAWWSSPGPWCGPAHHAAGFAACLARGLEGQLTARMEVV